MVTAGRPETLTFGTVRFGGISSLLGIGERDGGGNTFVRWARLAPCHFLLVTSVVLAVLYTWRMTLLPFMLGLVMAYLFWPVVRFIGRLLPGTQDNVELPPAAPYAHPGLDGNRRHAVGPVGVLSWWLSISLYYRRLAFFDHVSQWGLRLGTLPG